MDNSLSAQVFSLGGLNISWFDMLVLSSVLVSWMAAALAFYCLRQARRQNLETQAMVQDLNRDLQVAGRGAIGMGQRIIALERKLVAQGVEPASVMAGSAEIKPFAAAMKAASKTGRLRVVSEQAQEHGLVTKQEDCTQTCFDDASQLLADGMDVEEVANRCGLTRSEAALMAMLQRQKGVVAAT